MKASGVTEQVHPKNPAGERSAIPPVSRHVLPSSLATPEKHIISHWLLLLWQNILAFLLVVHPVGEGDHFLFDIVLLVPSVVLGLGVVLPGVVNWTVRYVVELPSLGLRLEGEHFVGQALLVCLNQYITRTLC